MTRISFFWHFFSLDFFKEMPKFFRRRFRRVRRRARPSGWVGKIAGGARLAYRAWRMAKYIKGLVNSELYKFDATFSSANVSDTGNVTHLTAIAQGDGVAARTGNSIYVRAVNIHGTLTFNVAASVISQTVRVAIIVDTQQIGDIAPSLTTIYSASGPYGHLNADTVGRFKVLWTRTYILDTNNPTLKVDINIPMKHHVRFNGTASTDIQKGGIYFIASSSQSTANYPTFSGESRVSYHDN